ncbi:TPA: hypothetical protein QDB46_003383 [Burkholderia multivorans]|nr:hypothetical protein [Burkholderia multivorans]HDR9293857.1 hypothetical protein [Burkholderia multivorans]HDR9299671.1 hypothetical protein [Burkholderia multivorans]HDR9303405.1 hypothetical protein [Burkholderia multivorans]HDR9311456.1 hypothetical protein [Burkholderia multivorans]
MCQHASASSLLNQCLNKSGVITSNLKNQDQKMSEEPQKPICGIVMPISSIDGCSESHWAEVASILTEAIEAADFSANIVSNADDIGIIHKRIIQNLYDNPVVVCDVSGKNPNVMFELGMRLAFDKPTVIVKDDKTPYSFDTSAIEHLEYPRDLRFSRIVEFKKILTEKILATHEKSVKDPNFSTFLKHFGEFKVAKIDKKEVSGQEYILDEIKSLRFAIQRIDTRISKNIHEDFIKIPFKTKSSIAIPISKLSRSDIDIAVKRASIIPGLVVGFTQNESGDAIIEIDGITPETEQSANELVRYLTIASSKNSKK